MSRKEHRPTTFVWLIIGPLILSAAAACYRRPPQPNLPRIFSSQAAGQRTGKAPVILIPGVFGSRLVNRRTGETLWPGLLVNNEALALPITSPNLAENTDEIVATEILEGADFGPLIPEIGVYSSLLVALEHYGGYRRASFESPPPDGDQDTFYIFAYDWRRDLVESARLLARQIAMLKQRLGRPDLRFDIVAHSTGGLIARYYAMYGDRDILAEDTPHPDWAGARALQRLVLIGTPNAGTIFALKILLDGYSVARGKPLPLGIMNKLIRNLPIVDFTPDTAFTAPAVYELLPPPDHARFFDAQLAPLKLDVYDVETWRHFGWSVAFDEQRDERKQRGQKQPSAVASTPGTHHFAARERFLRVVLARARNFHRALNAARPPPDILRLSLLGGDCISTLDAAVIIPDVKRNGRVHTIFHPQEMPGGKRVQRHAAELLLAPGDGTITRRSLFGNLLNVNSSEAVLPATQADSVRITFFCERHEKLPLNLTIQDNLLTALLLVHR